MTVAPLIKNKIISSAYLLKSFNIWHEQFGHVNFITLS